MCMGSAVVVDGVFGVAVVVDSVLGVAVVVGVSVVTGAAVALVVGAAIVVGIAVGSRVETEKILTSSLGTHFLSFHSQQAAHHGKRSSVLEQ